MINKFLSDKKEFIDLENLASNINALSALQPELAEMVAILAAILNFSLTAGIPNVCPLPSIFF